MITYDNFNKNLAVSPLNVFFILSMLKYGANGITEKMMQKILKLPENEDKTEQELKNINKLLNVNYFEIVI